MSARSILTNFQFLFIPCDYNLNGRGYYLLTIRVEPSLLTQTRASPLTKCSALVSDSSIGMVLVWFHVLHRRLLGLLGFFNWSKFFVLDDDGTDMASVIGILLFSKICENNLNFYYYLLNCYLLLWQNRFFDYFVSETFMFSKMHIELLWK